ncbi:MAG: PKD domain-containing protein [Motiliproteus sp.]
MGFHYFTDLNRRYLPIATIGFALTLPAASLAQAQPPERIFGSNAPFSIDELPPGKFRNALKNLPPQAKERAMSWLHSFTFPAQDVGFLNVDRQGGVFYADSYLPDLTETLTTEVLSSSAAADPSTVLTLHSKPNASKIVFLDFDGHTISGTAWNSTYSELVAKPFDLDGNPSSFSADEAGRIAEMWHRIAEDYAPYDIDVTTQDPATLGIKFGPQVARVLITTNSDQNGRAMPYASSGGVAYVNVWGRSDFNSTYSPAFVYYNNLANGTTYIAEAASHELGHNLGLSHDGTGSTTYYGGHGADSSLVSWAPIMGSSYYKNVTQWSKGEYSGANNGQDDLAIINGKLGYRADDHGDSQSSASLLVSGSDGAVSTSNPETDAYNDLSDNKGIIGNAADIDLFYFDSGAGSLSLTVSPAWDAFYRSARRGSNLDVSATLIDEQGTIIASSEPLDDTQATVIAEVNAGRYYLAVEGAGNSQTPYSDYGSIGQYFIAGAIVPTGVSQNTYPSAAFNASCVDMGCTFSDLSSDSDGNVVSWQWDFGDGNVAGEQHPIHPYLVAGTYAATLTVTDNEGASSTTARQVSISDPNAIAPDMPASLITADNGNGTATLSWSTVNAASQYAVQRQNKHPKNGKWTGIAIVATVAAPAISTLDSSGAGTFRYSVRSENSYGVSGWSNWVEITVSGGSGGGGSKGGGGKCNPRKGSC